MFLTLWARLLALYQKLGFLGVTNYVWRKLTSNPYDPHSLESYSHTLSKPFGATVAEGSIPRSTINWVVPDFGIGSGGHINIFRLVRMLELEGFRSTIHIWGNSEFASEDDARASLRQHFSAVDADVRIGHDNMEPAEFTVATSWPTAYAVNNFRATSHKLYFVQDYEPYFYPRGSDFWISENTYRLGFRGITAGPWLAKKLASDFGMTTTSMGFSFDRSLYRPIAASQRDHFRVFFYARPSTARRGYELGLLAMQRIAALMPDVEFVLAGWDLAQVKLPFRHALLGSVAVGALAEVYNSCDVALVLSATNVSLLPLELMACGVPVVSNSGENVEWLLSPDNSILCLPTAEALADGVVSLLRDPAKRKLISEAGLAFSAATSWEREGRKVAELFKSMQLYRDRTQ